MSATHMHKYGTCAANHYWRLCPTTAVLVVHAAGSCSDFCLSSCCLIRSLYLRVGSTCNLAPLYDQPT
jgi:hypothetical protein